MDSDSSDDDNGYCNCVSNIIRHTWFAMAAQVCLFVPKNRVTIEIYEEIRK